jgi:hypothetical protein
VPDLLPVVTVGLTTLASSTVGVALESLALNLLYTSTPERYALGASNPLASAAALSSFTE